MIKKYKSAYGADSDITAAQYLCEFIMQRIAKKNKEVLPHKFWHIPKWNKQFRMQIKFANELLAEYDEREIFEALRSKRGQRIFSLGAKKTLIVPLIEEMKRNKAEKVSVSIEDDTNEFVIDDDEQEVPEVKTKNNNLWSKL